MFDETVPSTPMQRVHGRAAVRIGAGGRLRDLHQSGAAKVMLPKMHGRPPEIVFLNTAGGITGGDHLRYDVVLEDGAAAVATTQTAERAYRAAGGTGSVETHLTVGADATLFWLPQEVILFDGAALDRHLSVDLAPSATAVVLESLVLGRAAMGEVLRDITLRDRRHVRRAGQRVLVEAIELTAADLARQDVAGLDGAVALATVSLFADHAPDRLASVRTALNDLHHPDLRAGASAWGGRLTLRMAGPTAHDLRRSIARIIPLLTDAPLPRVWQI